MQYRSLGSSSLQLSVLSFGSWITFGTRLDQRGTNECLACAFDHGINFFDSAEVYLGGEAERMLGRGIESLGWSRDSYCISSKVLFGTADNHSTANPSRPTQQGLSRKHITEACNQALQRFGVDYLDFYLCHRPEPGMSTAEIAWTMNTLIQQGKVLHWGTSEWPAEDILRLIEFCQQNCLIPPQLEQPQYNLFHRKRVEREYQPLIHEHGLGLTTWSPLASGVLAGRYDEGIAVDSRLATEGFSWLEDFVFENKRDERIEAAKRIKTIADELGATRAQLALAWAIKNEAVTSVLIGASSVAQLQENLGALDVLPKLENAVLRKIDENFR
ncbi:alcohol dehydrogenase [Pseudomonas sp. PA15(2017)]|uniref:aldo/keto reductase n=1 Tax=Pseudomonas sp. PA15(2017) TaxID=1932111 RepID=UPI000965587E|nr:aldo/keto reductase [Pseudomonas sp. PA15(2017)]OLU29090.1 alcohol dehydrogenase [Pseudomonas sp. PA15(2017)]